MNSRRSPARSLVVPGALLLAVSFALAGCAKGSDTAKEGPITSRMNALYGDGGNADEWRAENDRYEEVVAACMKENGFDYTPVPMSDDSFETWSEEDWDPVAEAKENGYGITPASKEALIEQYGLGEVPAEAVVDDGAGSLFADDDPNAEYYNSLSASDQAAYQEALSGPALDDDMGDSSYEYDWTQSGCYGEAFHEVYESQMQDQDEQDSTVMDDFYAYTDDKTSNDPRMTEATAAWASCMTDKGYGFTAVDEPRTEIQSRFDELTGTDSNAEEWTEPDLDLFSDEDIVALHDEEIATATADAQCIVDAKMYDVWEKVYLDAETEFYNTHKSEVDAWFAAQEAALKKD